MVRLGTSRCPSGIFALLAAAAIVPGSRAAAEDKVLQWADRHGVNHSAVEIRSFLKGGGAMQVRGLAAARDIKNEEIIATVPMRLALHSNQPPSVDACKGLWSRVEDSHQRHILLILVEHSLGEASQWYEYMQSLPSLSDYADFYPYAARNVAEEFFHIPIIEAHANWRQNLEELQQGVAEFLAESPEQAACFEAGVPSFEDFLWAECVVSTRSYASSGKHGIVAPLLDFANSPEVPADAPPSALVRLAANSEWHEEVDFMTVTATRDIARGEEITEPYGIPFVGGLTHDYILDAWGFLPEAARATIEPLDPVRCKSLRPVVRKYLAKDGCTAVPVACNLATLAKLACQMSASDEL